MIKKCKICSQEFQTRPSHVKMGWGKFCSNKCHYLSMKTGKFVECDECKIKIYKNNTKLGRSKSGKYFCGKSCQTKWRNKFFSGNKHLNWIKDPTTYEKYDEYSKLSPTDQAQTIKSWYEHAVRNAEQMHVLGGYLNELLKKE